MNPHPQGLRSVTERDRILTLFAAGTILVFLAFDLIAYRGTSRGLLENRAHVLAKEANDSNEQATNERLAIEDPLVRPIAITTTEHDPAALGIDPTAFFTDDELVAWRVEGARDTKKHRVEPPLNVRAERRGSDVLVRWDPNPVNNPVGQGGTSSLLTVGYQVYRWHDREDPALVENAKIDVTSYLDRGVGPRGGALHYSVKTVLKDQIGNVETLIESSDPQSVRIELDELFELAIVSATDTRAVIAVTVPVDSDQRSHQFEVDKGAQVGSILRLDETEVDFRTGLTLESTTIVETVSRRPRRVPVFNADGSRASGESGYLYRDEVREVPIHRITCRLVDESGTTRELTREEDVVAR